MGDIVWMDEVSSWPPPEDSPRIEEDFLTKGRWYRTKTHGRVKYVGGQYHGAFMCEDEQGRLDLIPCFQFEPTIVTLIHDWADDWASPLLRSAVG
jgi:hypothetical protein